MKTAVFCKVFFVAIVLSSVTGCFSGEEPIDKTTLDSIRAADSLAMQFNLENLLNFTDESDLIRRYGNEAVRYDTIWGAEGYFSMGTLLKTEPQSHIEITWANEKMKTGIISVTQVSDSDWYSDTLEASEWKSSTGVVIGMSIEELQKLNGRPFTFSGFGWDYAGSVIDWQKGNLEGKGIAVQLAEGPFSGKLTDEQSATILGDVMVQSDNPLVKQFAPRVWSISVAK